MMLPKRRAALYGAGASLALTLAAFACGSNTEPPPACDGADCADVATPDASSPTEAGPDGPDTNTPDADAAPDAGDASDTGSACTGPAGTLDPTFGDGGMVVLTFAGENASADAVLVQPDGKVVVGGVKTPAGDSFALVRLTSNGALDPTFGSGGVAQTRVGNTSHAVRAVALQPDGKILLAGYTRFVGQNFDFAVLRYSANGVLDPTFGTDGVVLTDFSSRTDQAMAMALMGDGRIVLSGQTLSDDLTIGDMAFARYNADGSLDTTFGNGGRAMVDVRGTPDQARGIALLAGGKIVAAGTSRDPAVSRTDIAAVRLNADGTLDPAFGTAGVFVTSFGGPGSQTANAVVLDPTGRPVLGGSYGTTAPRDFSVIRLTAAGAFDPTFGSSGLATLDFQGRDDNGSFVLAEASGNYLVGGSSLTTTGPSEPRVGLARLLADGGIDPTFGTAGKALTQLPPGFSGLASAGALSPCAVTVVGGWIDGATNLSSIGVVRYRR